MDDLATRRKLEVGIDSMLLSKDKDVLELAVQAKQALKEKKLEEAVKLLTKAEMMNRPLRLIDMLVSSEGGLQSKAEARRIIESSGVRVDDRVARDVDMDVKYAQRIVCGNKVLRGS